jgi:Sap, sulfolipid-1-addressing protein
MWGLLLGMALSVTLHPMRIGVILIVVSRPRPVQNLLTYWLGCMMLSVTYLLVPLMAVHVIPTFASFTKNLATPGTVANSTARHIEFGMGVVALSIAALMAVRFSARQRAHLPTPGGDTSTLVLDSNTPTAISWLLGRPATGGGRHRAQKAPTAGGSAIRRLLGRAHNAWENGSLWVSLVISIAMSPTLDAVLLIVAIIVASGAAIGTQVSAAIAFVVVMLAVEEIVLASYLVTPAKTQAVVRLLHDWGRAHRRKVLVAIFAVVGVSLVAYGMGFAGG